LTSGVPRGTIGLNETRQPKTSLTKTVMPWFIKLCFVGMFVCLAMMFKITLGILWEDYQDKRKQRKIKTMSEHLDQK
jgi:hypothetical protein